MVIVDLCTTQSLRNENINKGLQNLVQTQQSTHVKVCFSNTIRPK
jgi:hypothetical protein